MKYLNYTQCWVVYILFLPLAASLSFQQMILPTSTTPFQCPKSCKCNRNSVNCEGARLNHIPMDIPQNTTELHLEFNAIQSIKPTDVHVLIQLEALYLRGNFLKSFPHEILQYLPKLKRLDLSDNPLSCSCSLKWMSWLPYHKIQRTKWGTTSASLEFVNRNRTRCVNRAEGLIFSAFEKFQGCGSRLRFKRNPGCTLFSCNNRGFCLVERDGERRCECRHPFHGLHCELEGEAHPPPDNTKVSQEINVHVERVGPSSIDITWTSMIYVDHQKSVQVKINRIIDDVGVQSITPIQDHQLPYSQTRYRIEHLEPGAQYEICIIIYVLLGDRYATACIRQHTSGLDTSSAVAVTDLESSLSSNWNKVQFLDKDDNHQDYKDSHKDFVHTALATLAAIFGVCALLTMVVGFLYYKGTRTTPSTANRTTTTTNDAGTDLTSPQQEGNDEIILVSVGNEMQPQTYDNQTYDHSNENSSREASGKQTIVALSGNVQANRECNTEQNVSQNMTGKISEEEAKSTTDIQVKPKLVRFAFKDVYNIPCNDELGRQESSNA